MAIILTNKAIEKEKQKMHEEMILRDEHHQLAIEHALLLDFVHVAASSKRFNGKFTNNREELKIKACKVLDQLKSGSY